jgi:hypothetical protein
MKNEDIRNMGLAHRQVQEAGTATQKPNNGSDAEQGLSPNAKKEKARTSGVGVDGPKSIDMSFKAFRANSKAAKYNGSVNPPGDKAIVKSTTAPAANQKTESVDLVAEKKKAKKDDKLDDGDGMDPVGKADADIDNDGDVDKTDDYLNNRRDAIRSKMKGKGKKEDAVMHGGKGGAKSEKKEKETMSVGEGAMKRMSTGDGMDTFKKKPKMASPRQMKDPKKDAMVSKGGKVKVIDKDKEDDHLKRGYNRAEDFGNSPNTKSGSSYVYKGTSNPKQPSVSLKTPAKPQRGLIAPVASKGRAY